VTDRIVLHAMAFEGRHGALPGEKAEPQPFEVDVEMAIDLAPAGRADDLALTVDYGAVHALARRIVETTSRDLVEAIAEEIAAAVLAGWPAVEAVVVRVRKMRPPIDGRLAWAGVEVRRVAGGGPDGPDGPDGPGGPDGPDGPDGPGGDRGGPGGDTPA
jgi:dihydroneopterin aldolase